MEEKRSIDELHDEHTQRQREPVSLWRSAVQAHP